MKYPDLCHFAPLELKGIGDEPLSAAVDGAILITHKPCGRLSRGFKVDQHASFPQGLPRAFRLTDEHMKD